MRPPHSRLKTLMDDSIQIRCTRCKGVFRDRARRVQPGYSRQCPGCEVVIFFEESSSDKNVQKSLLASRRLRRELREQEAIRPLRRKAAPAYRRSGP